VQPGILKGDITDMSVNSVTFVRKLVSLPHAMFEAIDDFRFQNRIKSESETIRRLIERGIKRSEPASPLASTEETRLPTLPGPYPWEKSNLENVLKAMNVSLPARLKMQLDWLANQSASAGNAVTLRSMVTEVLTNYVHVELRARSIDPG
jgi:hypothetical protein